MPYAIITEFKGPTNSRGAYIVAKTAANNPITGKPFTRRVPYDHAKSPAANHTHAANCLAVFAGLTIREFVQAELNTSGAMNVFVPYYGEVVPLGKE
jgi:hypothetical protein